MVIARAIRLLVGIIVAIIVVAVILRVLNANPHNVIVSDIHDAGSTLVGPFKDIFSVKGAKLAMALNWGLAAVVYAVVGGFLATLVGRGALAGSRRRRFARARPVV